MVLLAALLYAASLLVCLHLSSFSIADPDIWWHLRTGEWILDHHTAPRTDPFSVSGANHPWLAYSWLFEVLVFKLDAWFGLCGIVAYTAALSMAITVAFHRLVRRLGTDFTESALLTMVVMISIARFDTPRPWLFTILFFVLELDVLMNVRNGGSKRELMWLPVLFVFWANLHIQFVDGLLLLVLAAFEPTMARCLYPAGTRVLPSAGRRQPVNSLWPVFAACVLATLVNPYGWRVYKAAYDLVVERGVLDKISELQAIPFRDPADFLLLFLALAAAGALAASRRPPVFESMLLAIAAILSFRSQRDLWFMAVSASTILACARRRADHQLPLPSWAVSVAVLGAVIVALPGALLMQVNNPHLQSLLAEQMPVRAVEIVRERGYRGALYNNYDWGGFMMWNLRVPVSIDGRAALQGEERIDRSAATWSGDPRWISDPELSTAGVIIAPVKAPLTQLLRMDHRFQLAFEDKVAVVFIPRSCFLSGSKRPCAL